MDSVFPSDGPNIPATLLWNRKDNAKGNSNHQSSRAEPLESNASNRCDSEETTQGASIALRKLKNNAQTHDSRKHQRQHTEELSNRECRSDC
jgi:hypothetical protein